MKSDQKCCNTFQDGIPYLRRACKADIPGFDFKTSTEVGLRYSAPVPQLTVNKPALIPAELRGRDPLVNNNTYRPVISGDLDWKLPEPFEKADKVPCSSLQYIKPYGEKVIAHPPNPPRQTVSEAREQYQRPWPVTRQTLVDLRDDYLCKVKKDASQSPSVSGFEYEGFSRILDPYISTTHFDYHHIQKRDADFYRSKPIDTSTILTPRIRPIYDKLVFKNACFNNRVHCPPRFLPGGLTSETSASFGHPLTKSDLVYFDPNVEYGAAPHVSSKGEIMSTPAMYLTEYTHISEGWPVNACVKYGDKDVDLVLCEP